MKRLVCVIFTLPAMVYTINAQQLSPSVLAADGGTASDGEIIIEWTLGEPFVQSIYASENIYTEGFHQPVLKVERINNLLKEDEDLASRFSGLLIDLAPNPVESTIMIHAESQSEDVLILRVTDLSGRELSVKKYSTPIKEYFDMAGYISGMYIFTFNNPQGEVIESFKISKIK